jgi:hypothetical protein
MLKYGPLKMMDLIESRMKSDNIASLKDLLESSIIRDCVEVHLYNNKDRDRKAVEREYKLRRLIKDGKSYAFKRVREG